MRYKENATHILPFLIIFSLLLIGFNIPKISIAAPLIILPIILYTLSKRDLRLNKFDLIINILLLGFSTSYYMTLWIHEYIELVRGIRYILAIQGFYLLGHYSFFTFRKKSNDTNLLMPIIFLSLGFSIYALLPVLIESISQNTFYISNRRQLINPWQSSYNFATCLATFSSLGIALIPVGIKLLFMPKKK
jgi:hypothetical protein